MKTKLIFILAVAVLSACSSDMTPADGLKARLAETAADGKILFGQQDALMYGHSWKAEPGDSLDRSDIKDVCGKHPAVLGLDLGGIEMQDMENLDGNPFAMMREAAVRHHERGGVVTFSWHPRNPMTGGDSWDISSPEAVASVLEGGEKHEMFMGWLSACADFLGSLKDAEGNLIPVIFRPWHEHTGSWFWWGQDLCTTEQYLGLWKMTYDYMSGRGLDNLVWAYSPGAGPDAAGYMERYPGDDMVDLLGLDCYQYGEAPQSNAAYSEQLKETLSYMTVLGKEHGKPIALTETGFEGIPYGKWWTEVLYPAVKDYPLSYLLVWRNAWDRESHFYGPWKGSLSEADFLDFVAFPDILLLPE